MMKIVLAVQLLTFVAFGIYLLRQGQWNIGLAQLGLAIVNGLIFAPALYTGN